MTFKNTLAGTARAARNLDNKLTTLQQQLIKQSRKAPAGGETLDYINELYKEAERISGLVQRLAILADKQLERITGV